MPDDGRRVYIATSDELTPFAVELRRAIERVGRRDRGDARARRRPWSASSATAAGGACSRCRRATRRRNTRSSTTSNTRSTAAASEILELQPLELIRNLSFEESQLLAKDREEAILRDAMARDLAMLVLRRLESLPAAAAAGAPE